MFPRRPVDAPPIFTPPATHQSQPYGSPTYPTGSLNDRMASDVETLRLHFFNSIQRLFLVPAVSSVTVFNDYDFFFLSLLQFRGSG
jgi:hypothetical protein